MCASRNVVESGLASRAARRSGFQESGAIHEVVTVRLTTVPTANLALIERATSAKLAGVSGSLRPDVLYAVRISHAAARAARMTVIASTTSKMRPLVSLTRQ